MAAFRQRRGGISPTRGWRGRSKPSPCRGDLAKCVRRCTSADHNGATQRCRASFWVRDPAAPYPARSPPGRAGKGLQPCQVKLAQPLHSPL
ncbi:hypothetical protein OH686_20580 [Pseudomonas sp. SO81]|nr:hypothetical protein OH686_20580 [Pseudomonas sp. SO81]